MTQKTNYDYLTDGFYGHVNQTIETDHGTLIELHLAEWAGDESWECSDWYLDTGDDDPVHIANCNGTDGVEFLTGWHDLDFSDDEDRDDEIREELDELIESYQPTGLYKSARIAGMEKATEDDEDGEFVIVEESIFFESDCNAEWNNRPNIVTSDEEDGDELVFETYRDAEKYVDELDGGTYYTAHGEAGRPNYTIYKL